MKYLGEGYYYKAYLKKDKTVYKKFQPYWFSCKKIYAYERKQGKGPIESLLTAHRSRLKEKRALREIKQRLRDLPGDIFANASFFSGLDYTQDLVVPVEKFFESNDLMGNKKVVDSYIAFQRFLWSRGVHDKTYKIQQNYGIDEHGSLVCLDFGEFVYTLEEAVKSVQGKKWQKRETYRLWKDTSLKEYYTLAMEQMITERNLSKYWKNDRLAMP